MEVKILTGDRDAFQLASEKVSIWYTKGGYRISMILIPSNSGKVWGDTWRINRC